MLIDRLLPIRLPATQKPILVTVIDTEEEFDWSRCPDPAATSVRAMKHVDRIQAIFDAYKIRPTYVVDYPVASQAEGFRPLKEIQDSGRCEIGAHLHPWVNPPVEEVMSPRNTYGCNLAPDLEARKLEVLTQEIERSFERRPRVFKAGRYGLGEASIDTLGRLGYEVDVSVFPCMDWRGDGGPDFSRAPHEPARIEGSTLLEVPLTGGFVGLLSSIGRPVHRLANSAVLRRLRLPGILSRMRLVDRLALSPEAYTSEEHLRLTKHLLARGVRVFSWTLHSPSVEPGCTPYVRDQSELRRFLDRFKSYFDIFFGELGGVAMTPMELKRHLEATR